MNKVKIMEEQWEFLIILDACRYDYFESIWKNYFKGELAKVMSVGSCTHEWRDKSFQNYYDDVCYISANPYINSIKPTKGFTGSKHFYKVYDVWKEGWDERKGTVLPETVTNMAVDLIHSNRNRRIIIHYLQPHAPYLDLGRDMPGFLAPDLDLMLLELSTRPKIRKRASEILPFVLNNIEILGNRPEWAIREFLHLKPVCPEEMTIRTYGKAGLRAAYKRNLEIVVVEVLRLMNYLSGRIVITSDHGELLGEGRCYGHWRGSNNPYLIEIPWLIIEKRREWEADVNSNMRNEKGEMKEMEQGSVTSEKTYKEDQKKIMKRLRDLGYLD